jgi:hypothetical protein
MMIHARSLVAVITTACSLTAHAAPPCTDGWGKPPAPRSESATTLTGHVHALLVFAGPTGDAWSHRERLQRVAWVERSMAWLQQQGAERGSALRWSVSCTETDALVPAYGPNAPEWEAASEDVVRHVVAHAGGDARALHQRLGGEQLVLIIFHKAAGRAFAMPTYRNSNYLEAAVVFERHRNGNLCGTAVLPHELLHLFDAEDLYTDNGRGSSSPNELARSRCRGDIMSATGDLEDFTICDHTARLIGWREEGAGSVAEGR